MSTRIVSLRTTPAMVGPVNVTVTVRTSAAAFEEGGTSCQSRESATA